MKDINFKKIAEIDRTVVNHSCIIKGICNYPTCKHCKSFNFGKQTCNIDEDKYFFWLAHEYNEAINTKFPESFVELLKKTEEWQKMNDNLNEDEIIIVVGRLPGKLRLMKVFKNNSLKSLEKTLRKHFSPFNTIRVNGKSVKFKRLHIIKKDAVVTVSNPDVFGEYTKDKKIN